MTTDWTPEQPARPAGGRRRHLSVDAGKLWAGGIATALVAALASCGVRSEGFVVVVDSVPIPLLVCSRVSASLIDRRELVPVFVVHRGGFLKQINRFIPVLAFSGLSTLEGESVRFGILFVRFGTLFFCCRAYL